LPEVRRGMSLVAEVEVMMNFKKGGGTREEE